MTKHASAISMKPPSASEAVEEAAELLSEPLPDRACRTRELLRRAEFASRMLAQAANQDGE
jgi:hypothetical protein